MHAVKSYVNGIPLGAVLARAGFQSHLHVPRSTVKADDELVAQIFPNLESLFEELSWYATHVCQSHACVAS